MVNEVRPRKSSLSEEGVSAPSATASDPPAEGPPIQFEGIEALDSNLAPSKDQHFLNRLSILCAGCALICDGYHNQLMGATNLIFKQEYPEEYTSKYTTAVSNAMTVGQILGMITFGLTCDLISRKRAIVFTTLFMVVGAILATAAHGKTTQGMFWMIIVMRGVIGFGVGGEFPTSSAITLEAAAENERAGGNKSLKSRRGWLFILVVNLPLQFGGPLAMSCLLIVWEAANGPNNLSTIWRVMFGIGCVWPVLVFLMRLKLVTSQLFRDGKFIDYNIPWLLAFKFYWRRLLATCGSFLLYDMIVQPNGVFSSLIIKDAVDGGDTKTTMEWQLLLGTLTLPGIFIGAAMCEWVGRKRTMMIGFAGFLVFGVIIGAAFEQLEAILPLFVVFYGLFQCVGHMGPGTMIGLLTTESYATGVRGTFYALSLAFGRVGGVIGTEIFNPIKKDLGQRWTFFISAIIGAVAIVYVWLMMPNLDSRDIKYEDMRFEHYLRMHGFHSKIGFMEGDPNSSSEEDSSSDLDKQPTEHVTAVDYDEAFFTRKDDRTFWQRVFSMDPLNI